MTSIWQDSCSIRRRPQLNGTVKTDVLIIGAGLTGILCASFLKDLGINCIVVEAHCIGQGISSKTTAKITSQHGLIYDKLLQAKGWEHAELYLKANEDAVKMYGKLCEKIECGFQKTSNFVYSLQGKDMILREIRALESLGFSARYTEETQLPFRVDAAVEFPLQAQFNPMKFIATLAEDLEIYENSPVLKINKKGAETEHSRIEADCIIVASHFPFINRHGAYFIKMYQQRSYVIAGEGGKALQGMYVDASGDGLSLRNCGDLTIVGGGSQRTGKVRTGWKELEGFCREFFPNWELKYH